MKTMIVGHGGREAALATKMAAASSLFAYMGHENPSIARLVREGGGTFEIGDVCDRAKVARFAAAHEIDVVMVSADDPLAAGVVDGLAEVGVSAVGPTRSGAQIEWDKAFSRHVVAEVAPETNPRFAVVRSRVEVEAAVGRLGAECGDLVVKPVGLSGGKGVKVVGPHLADNEAATAYACDIVSSGRHGGAAIIEERVAGPEFTIQAMTDGRTVVFPPATYDYPYRFGGDTGPGTGGMGCVTMPGGLFPFLDAAIYQRACDVVRGVLDYLARQGRPFSGCLNAGFFVVEEGLRSIEFNARFGDPEGINVMALLESDWVQAMAAMAAGRLHEDDVVLADDATAVLYLVAPSYAVEPSDPIRFAVDAERAERHGAAVLFSSSVETSPGVYRTVGTSRAVALTARAGSLDAAVSQVMAAAETATDGALEWRHDIGSLPTTPGP